MHQELYPEIHNRLWNFVDEAARGYDSKNLDEATLSQMSEHVINRSGIFRNPPRGHSRQSIDDFVRFLLLCRILGHCPPLFPPVTPPVFPMPPVRPMPPHGRPPHTPPRRPR